jgi:hypothetical protein
MAKVNFQLQKRQKELARKSRQSDRLNRRGEQAVAATPPLASPPLPKTPGSAT